MGTKLPLKFLNQELYKSISLTIMLNKLIAHKIKKYDNIIFFKIELVLIELSILN